MIAIVDYGMANLRSVQTAFERLGAVGNAKIISKPDEVMKASRLVVPGVGAFADAIRVLNEKGLSAAIKDFVKTGRPMLGICLGLQLLMEVGYEDGVHEGLGIITGDCVRFTCDEPPLSLKVPHMGWNELLVENQVPLFKGLPQGSYAYFVHSYHVRPRDESVVACRADYGGKFVAAIARENVFATQFHPEKSQGVGAVILRNFANL